MSSRRDGGGLWRGRRSGALRAAAALSAAYATAAVPTAASAFSTQGNRWANQAGDPVIFLLHPDGSADVEDGSELEAIRRAFATWDSVACSYLEFREDPWVDPLVVAQDGVNRIFWVEEGWPEQPATLALTYTFFRNDTHEILDADIIVNGVNWRFTTVDAEIGQGTPAAVDVETVLFHEIGHFFGLNHSQDPNAAMFPSNNKPMQRSPASDDVQGICALYSNGQPIPDAPTGGGPVGAPCEDATDCASNRCARDDLINRTYCTAQCNPAAPESCPAGYECATTQEGNYCLAPAAVDELCDTCDQGGQCATGYCTTVPNVNNNRPFCSQACDPTPGQPAQCPAGYNCQAVLGAAGGACSPNTGVCEPAGKGGQNEICYANGTCKAGYTCVEYFAGSGLNFCYFACATQYVGLSCTTGGGTRCDYVRDVENSAVCFSIAYEGQPCIPEVCDPTSWCAIDDGGGIDSALCYRICNGNQDCGDHAQCQAVPGAPNLCVPNQGFKYEGERCASDAECRSSTCRTYGQNRLCTATCATTDPASCGAGFKCLPQNASTQGLCWPEAYTDPGATDPTRPITMRPAPAGFCSCDFSTACDPDCECDPECSEGCGCSVVAERSGGGLPNAGAAALALAALLGGLGFGGVRTRGSRGPSRRSPRGE